LFKNVSRAFLYQILLINYFYRKIRDHSSSGCNKFLAFVAQVLGMVQKWPLASHPLKGHAIDSLLAAAGK